VRVLALVKKRVSGVGIRVAHVLVLVLILLVAAAHHGVTAMDGHHHHAVVVVVNIGVKVGSERSKGREGRDLEAVLGGHGLEDLETSPDLLVLALDRIHEVAGLVHLLDLLLQLLDVGLAAVAERPLSSAVLGCATWVGDVSGAGGGG
jgi:hypothetical protein